MAISSAAQRYALASQLIEAVAWRESAFHQDAISPKGAVGIMQLSSAAARDVGVDRFDLVQNIHGGVAYLRRLIDLYNGDLPMALAAYNAGPAAIQRYRGMPPFPETQAYVYAILARLGEDTDTSEGLPQ